MSPTSCNRCLAVFERRPLWQAKARQLAEAEDAAAAQRYVDAELAEYHGSGHRADML